MPPYSTEQSILEGNIEVKELFQYVQKNAESFDAYKMSVTFLNIDSHKGLCGITNENDYE